MTDVLDSSVVLASLFQEPGKAEADKLLKYGVISAVNLAEAATVLRRRGVSETGTREALASIADRVIPFDQDQAISVGLLYPTTKEAGLSMGDRACLALARLLSSDAVTTDHAWSRVAGAAGVRVRFIR